MRRTVGIRRGRIGRRARAVRIVCRIVVFLDAGTIERTVSEHASENDPRPAPAATISSHQNIGCRARAVRMFPHTPFAPPVFAFQFGVWWICSDTYGVPSCAVLGAGGAFPNGFPPPHSDVSSRHRRADLVNKAEVPISPLWFLSHSQGWGLSTRWRRSVECQWLSSSSGGRSCGCLCAGQELVPVVQIDNLTRHSPPPPRRTGSWNGRRLSPRPLAQAGGRVHFSEGIRGCNWSMRQCLCQNPLSVDVVQGPSAETSVVWGLLLDHLRSCCWS